MVFRSFDGRMRGLGTDFKLKRCMILSVWTVQIPSFLQIQLSWTLQELERKERLIWKWSRGSSTILQNKMNLQTYIHERHPKMVVDLWLLADSWRESEASLPRDIESCNMVIYSDARSALQAIDSGEGNPRLGNNNVFMKKDRFLLGTSSHRDPREMGRSLEIHYFEQITEY